MQRLMDHFVPLLPPAPMAPVAAEQATGRPPLQRGSFGGRPLWFHAVDGAATQCNGWPRTDAGQAFDVDDAIACLQFEHYVETSPADGARRARALYYLLKPFMPRSLQLELQRANARRRLRGSCFPAWPHDATLTELLDQLLVHRMQEAGVESIPFLGFWPRGYTWAWCLTHDVDTGIGYRHFEALAAVEEKRQRGSSWFFVPERYAIDRAALEQLRQRGHEIGVHGLSHTGKLFSSRAEFVARLPRVNDYVRQWGAVGFRSPATYRNPFWLPEIDVDYDSSYMDNATLEPQHGGICSAFPFMLSDRMVELPITLPMDHTLINVLRQDVVKSCLAKLDWVRAQNGLALALFHPDYNTTPERRERYGAVLDRLAADASGWYALPWQVADWWQRRRRSRVVLEKAGARIDGPAALDGDVWYAHRDGTRLRVEIPPVCV